jgi:hypothetical protein
MRGRVGSNGPWRLFGPPLPPPLGPFMAGSGLASRFQSGGRQSRRFRARSTMKGPAPCDGASLATGVAARGNAYVEGQGGDLADAG